MSDTQASSDSLLARLRRYAEQNAREPWIPVKAVELLALVEYAKALVAAREDMASHGILRSTHPVCVALAKLVTL
jgi:hypothetical protein